MKIGCTEAGESETTSLLPVEVQGDALPLRTSYCDSVFAFLFLRFCFCISSFAILFLHPTFAILFLHPTLEWVAAESFGNKLHISVLFPDNFSLPNYMISL